MKKQLSTWTTLALMLFALNGCHGTHEERGRQIGKKLDSFENSVKKKIEQGKETAHNAKENVEKKTHEFHEKVKEKAHDLINKG